MESGIDHKIIDFSTNMCKCGSRHEKLLCSVHTVEMTAECIGEWNGYCFDL